MTSKKPTKPATKVVRVSSDTFRLIKRLGRLFSKIDDLPNIRYPQIIHKACTIAYETLKSK